MRIGLYGMPTAGKSYILGRVDFMEAISGSNILHQMNPDFDVLDDEGRTKARKNFAIMMSRQDNFVLDGHYAFGDELAFTSEDGYMYDVIVYIYIAPDILIKRIRESERNRKYLTFDIAKWQMMEIENLRVYCHQNNKDFYVIDNPPDNEYVDVNLTLDFLRDINGGYSCLNYAKECTSIIIDNVEGKWINLLDGDKTITVEDTSRIVFGYKTNLYDGNFYTGFQAWQQEKEFENYDIPQITEIPVSVNEKVLSMCGNNTFILTSGHGKIWNFVASKLGYGCFCGDRMSAETKYFITKFLQQAGKHITAFGDGMNDYYMLKRADKGYLITKPDGKISSSLKERNMEGLKIVRPE